VGGVGTDRRPGAQRIGAGKNQCVADRSLYVIWMEALPVYINLDIFWLLDFTAVVGFGSGKFYQSGVEEPVADNSQDADDKQD